MIDTIDGRKQDRMMKSQLARRERTSSSDAQGVSLNDASPCNYEYDILDACEYRKSNQFHDFHDDNGQYRITKKVFKKGLRKSMRR
jgi:hypothetical protein